MGNKAKRPGQTSELVAATASSAPAMLAALVMQMGGRVLMSFEALAQVADQVNMTVATTAEGMLLQTHLKPIITGQVEVPEGPAGVADLGLGAPDVVIEDEELEDDERAGYRWDNPMHDHPDDPYRAGCPACPSDPEG